MGTPIQVCVWSCPNFIAPDGRPFRFDVLKQEKNVATIDDDVEPGYTIMLHGIEGSQIWYASIMEIHGMDITFNTAKILVLPVLLVVILGMASVNAAAHKACWKPIGEKALLIDLDVDTASITQFVLLGLFEDVITKTVDYHLFDVVVEFHRCVFLSYLKVVFIAGH
ncbi:hypothetical protein Tco_0883437 [Tanacetum coccineum]